METRIDEQGRETRVIRLATFIRPFEGWRRHADGTWQTAGRAFSKRGAHKRARALPERQANPSLPLTVGSAAPA